MTGDSEHVLNMTRQVTVQATIQDLPCILASFICVTSTLREAGNSSENVKEF
jgi:hypothetical protein